MWPRFATITDQTNRYRQIPTCRGLSEFVGDVCYMPPFFFLKTFMKDFTYDEELVTMCQINRASVGLPA